MSEPALDQRDGAWQGEARDLLQRAVARHGGRAAWQALPGVSLAPVRLTGMVPAVKGVGRTFPLPERIVIRPHEGVTMFQGYPRPGWRGIYANGRVQIIGDGGQVETEDANPRASFRGMAKHRRWSPLDALYFFGYALCHYHSLPFTLGEARPRRLVRARLRGIALRGVEVELPAHLHTHSRVQTFYFDGDGLLRRHDYVADIVGAWARGAHLWEDFVDVASVPIARRRRVLGRLGRVTVPLVALHAELADVVPLAA